jgi:methyl-accepting chemotaxis protein WspA
MKLTIGTRIGLGYLLAIIIILSVGLVSYFSVTKLLATSHLVEHTHRVLNKIDGLYVRVIEIETGQRGYIITNDEERLEPYYSGLKQLEADVSELRQLTKDNDQQQKSLDQLQPVLTARTSYAQRVVQTQKAGNNAGALRLIRVEQTKSYMGEIRSIIAQMKNRENQLLKQRAEDAANSARFATMTAIVGICGAPILLALAGLLITRSISAPLGKLTSAADRISSGDLGMTLDTSPRTDEIGSLNRAFARMVHALQGVAQAAERIATGDLSVAIEPQSKHDVVSHSLISMRDNLSALISQVQRSGIQVNSSATEIAATGKQQQATTSQISSTTAEIGSTSKEIAATSKELASAMRDVAQGTEETTQLATNGQSGLSRMEGTMRQIMEASSSINARLGVLSEKAGNINTVVTTITKVADQTNLLSLNAAIEAEKAGEYGRGFAVVATEIRRLADQTAGATYEVEQIVKEMQSAVSASVMGMDKFAEEVRRGVEEVRLVSSQLTQIIQQVQTMKPQFESVNEGMQAQSVGAQQISDVLLQLGEAAQQTAESLKQSNAAIEQLNEASRGLQSGIARFKLKS